MRKNKTIAELIAHWQSGERGANIAHIATLPKKPAHYADLPQSMHKKLRQALASRGITALYTHQRQAYDLAMAGTSFTAITPTASGKSYCYHLPVLQTILQNPQARALYLFPTKALAQDQLADVTNLIEAADAAILTYTYDGDTASNLRQKVRKAGHIVMTNPDMLHSGILPHHTKWVSLFENLKFIVIDELHTYKGVFGSHVAHVLRRLQRICAFYGANPTIICTSATIKNPKELAEGLTNTTHAVITQSGAPVGQKTFVFYNPPVTNAVFGVRKSAVLEVSALAKELYTAGIQTIVFARSRVRVEMIVTYLQELTKRKINDDAIMGYRGGYLPSERRVIERGLREGRIRTVVSTNALELGVDIGQLQACIMTGYPGTIASAWQQAGRAGRRQDEALIVYVAQSTALDQYIIEHPDFLLGQSPEEALIYPENMMILMDHLKCAAFELPFSTQDSYGGYDIQELLSYLAEEGVVFKTSEQWHWMSDRFPAQTISLRAAAQENVVIIDQSVTGSARVIGEMDRHSAMTLLHEEAIYLHQGIQYQVELLDWEEKKAFVREVEVDYYTDANLAVEMKVLDEDKLRHAPHVTIGYGDVGLVAQATIFKKIRFGTHDNIGSGPITLPPDEMHTNATWLSFTRGAQWTDEQLTDAMTAASYAMNAFIPLFIRCDAQDMAVVPQVKATHNELPTFFVYDRYPGGIGLSERVYDLWESLLSRTLAHVTACPCEQGCPACIGAQDGAYAKERVITLLQKLI